jgi:hypothetical protein
VIGHIRRQTPTSLQDALRACSPDIEEVVDIDQMVRLFELRQWSMGQLPNCRDIGVQVFTPGARDTDEPVTEGLDHVGAVQLNAGTGIVRDLRIGAVVHDVGLSAIYGQIASFAVTCGSGSRFDLWRMHTSALMRSSPAIQPDTMLARVKSGGVAAPLCGCGS